MIYQSKSEIKEVCRHVLFLLWIYYGWNKLPNHVKLISSYTSYKVFIRAMLLDSYE